MGGVFPFFGHFGDTATLAPTQRMLRKGEESIFAQIGRQVRCVLVYLHGILPFERQKAAPVAQSDSVVERLQATGTLAFELHFQRTFQQDGIAIFLSYQCVRQWAGWFDKVVQRHHVQVGQREFSIERNGSPVQGIELNQKRHSLSDGLGIWPSACPRKQTAR